MSYQLQDVAKAYDEKFSGEGFRNSDTFYRWALDILNPQPGQVLLDVACGMGDLLYYATQRRVQGFGLDLSPVAVQRTRERVPGVSAVVGNAESLAFADETFDCVTILGSLEHLLDPGKGLLEMRRVLKWGGKMLILVPNSFYLPDIIWRVWRTGYSSSHKQIVERFATAGEWRAFIESGGLAVRQIKSFNYQWPRNRDDWAWYRANPRRWLGFLARPLIPFNLSHSFIYLCEKDPASRGRAFSPPYWPVPPGLAGLGD